MSAPVVLELVMEFGSWGAHTHRSRGASWRAMFVEVDTNGSPQRYAGSDDSPWVAVAWAWHERNLRRAGGHAVARNEGDRPDGTVG